MAGRRVVLVAFLVLVLASVSVLPVWAYDWSLFRGGLNRCGVGPGQAPHDDYLHWSHTFSLGFEASPVVVDGAVFIGGLDGRVYSLNQSTGVELWNYSTGDLIYSSAAVADGRVFVGSVNGKVYALNQSTGAWIWEFLTGADVQSSPAVSDGVVFIGSVDDKVYALNQSTGVEVWNYTTGNSIYSSPAVVDGVVYVGSYDSKVYALNASTGAWIWESSIDSFVHSSPAVANGMVFVGSPGGKVYSLNQTTGAQIWNSSVGVAFFSSPAVAYGMVFIGNIDSKLYVLNQTTGVKIRDYPTGGPIYSSPAVADGMVFVGSDDRKIHALNASDGGKIWDYTTGSDVKASPAIADGMVFIASYDKNVYAFGVPLYPVPRVLDVVVSVGSPVFRGESVEFFVLSSIEGQSVDASITYALLHYGNGTFLANLTGMVVRVATGIYRISYDVPLDVANGSYYLVVKVFYSAEDVAAVSSSSICSFLISPTLTAWAAWLESINATLTGVQGSLAVVQSDVGTLLLDLVSINASITSIQGTIATIESSIGSIQVDLADLSADLSALVSELEDWQVTTIDLVVDALSFNLQVLTNSTLDDVSFTDYVVTVTVSGSDGFIGITHIWIPKVMLDTIGSSIEGIVVTLNEEQIEFLVSEGDENYVLTMTYTHSVDVIKIYLVGLPAVFPWQLVIFAGVLIGVTLGVVLYVYRRRISR